MRLPTRPGPRFAGRRGTPAAAPSGGEQSASLRVWAAALIVSACFEAVVITIGVRTSGKARGAAFGLAAACGYALTATLLKSAVAALDTSVAAFFSSWELYGTAVAGVGALFLLQNALQAGSLVAVQPPLTLGDAIISACYGVTVFGEDVNTGGGLLVIEILAVLAIAVGCIELSRSLAMVHQAQPQPAELPPPTGRRPARPGPLSACGRRPRCPSGSGRSRARPAPAARRFRRESRTRCR